MHVNPPRKSHPDFFQPIRRPHLTQILLILLSLLFGALIGWNMHLQDQLRRARDNLKFARSAYHSTFNRPGSPDHPHVRVFTAGLQQFVTPLTQEVT